MRICIYIYIYSPETPTRPPQYFCEKWPYPALPRQSGRVSGREAHDLTAERVSGGG